MFQSLYLLHRHTDRQQPEAVLTGKGVFVMLLLFLAEQLAAECIAVLIRLFNLPLGVMEINVIVNGGALLLIFFFFHGFFIANLKSFFKEFKAIYLWLPLTCYFCSTFANIIIQLFLAIARGELKTTSNNELVMQLLSQYPLPLILLTVVVAPITEEAIFRAALSRPMTVSKSGLVKAIGFTLSIFLFAFFHIYQYAFFATDASGAVYLTFNFDEFLSILVYIPMSIGLTLCSCLGKNYWCSVICHFITNSIAVLLMLAMGQQM